MDSYSRPIKLHLNEYTLPFVKKTVLSGNLIAFPTETVYGLGADYSNEEAIRKIYSYKKL